MMATLKHRSRSFVVTRRRLVIAALVVLLILLVVVSTMQNLFTIFESFEAEIVSNQSVIEDILYSNSQPPPDHSIFFHDTSCTNSNSHYHVMNLTARQACAIESAALNNPNFQVFIVFSCPTNRSLNERQKRVVDAIESYKNVNFRHLSLRNYAKGTPIEDWVKRDELLSSSFPMQHTSDLLRLISLYRFGGIYLDMDVVVLKSLEELPPNYMGAQDNSTLCNAVISLSSTGIGHEVAELFLQHYQKYFNGKGYVQNGPTLVTTVLSKFCGNSLVNVIQEGRKGCKGFRLFNTSAFYSIPWHKWEYFTEPKYMEETMEKTNDSFIIHLWNLLSSKRLIKIGSNSAYEKYAKKNCPRTYTAAGDYM